MEDETIPRRVGLSRLLWEIPVALVIIALIVATVVFSPAVFGLAPLVAYVYFASDGHGIINSISIGFSALVAYLILLVGAIIRWLHDLHLRRTSAATLAWALAPTLPVLGFLLFQSFTGKGGCFGAGGSCEPHQPVSEPARSSSPGPVPPDLRRSNQGRPLPQIATRSR
jgi:hypothetical protein